VDVVTVVTLWDVEISVCYLRRLYSLTRPLSLKGREKYSPRNISYHRAQIKFRLLTNQTSYLSQKTVAD
jgi:hypothetical protein